MISFTVQKVYVWFSSIFPFLFLFPLPGETDKKNTAKANIKAQTGYAFFRSFMVSGLTFRYVIYFEFIFVYRVRKCSDFFFYK